MKKFLITILLLIFLLTLSSCNLIKKEEESPAKVGLLLISSPDNSYSEGAYGYEALKFLESKYGMEISYNENIASENDASYWISNYGRQEYDLVIGLGNIFNDPMLKASSSFPNTKFVCIDGDKSEGNVTSYVLAKEDVNFLAGFITRFLTKVSSLGYIISGQGESGIDNFIKGAREVDSSVTVDKYVVKSSSNHLNIVNTLRSKGDTAAAIFLNSKDLENLLSSNGIRFMVVGGIRSGDQSAVDFPRIAFNYNGIFDRIYVDFKTDNLKGKNIDLGFKDGYIYVEGQENLGSEVKVKIDNLIKSFKTK